MDSQFQQSAAAGTQAPPTPLSGFRGGVGLMGRGTQTSNQPEPAGHSAGEVCPATLLYPSLGEHAIPVWLRRQCRWGAQVGE